MHNMANWQNAIAWAKYEELNREPERKEALQKLMARSLPLASSETMHLTPDWPFNVPDRNIITGIVFRVKPVNKTGRFEKSSSEVFFAT